MELMSPRERAIRSYFSLSPIADMYVNVKDMPLEDILDRLGIPLSDIPLEHRHRYQVVKIESYEQARRYFDYLGDWCIIASEAAFNDHTGWYNTEFYFCLRDDYKDVKKAFGPEYPYDNYGMSVIAVGVLPGGELESVTSRWNWDYTGDDYLDKAQLEQLLDVRFEDAFQSRFPIIRSILHISDTHGRHHELPELPAADVIVHSGDFTKGGTEEEVFDFVDWFCDLPQYRHKVFVAGNNDIALRGCDAIEGLDANCHYLSDSGITLDNLTFYGVSDFAPSRHDGTYPDIISRIPRHVDVLVTHEPPLGIADISGKKHFGSDELLQRVLIARPRYHLFGHVHRPFPLINGEFTTFSNGYVPNKFTPEKLKLIHLPISRH